MACIIDQLVTDSFALYHADCVDVASSLPDNSVDFSVFSPPFSSLYTYSNSDRDMGNAKSDAEFFEQFSFLVDQLYRVMAPGRIVAFHCMNLPASKQNDGFIGIKDFRGDLIRMFQRAGFHYHSEVTIWKDPVVAMQRTKAIGLLHKQLKKDSTISRQGIPDYLVMMRKPGDNTKPVKGELKYFVGDETIQNFVEFIREDGRRVQTPDLAKGGSVIDIWQRYASPVWMDINQTNTLQFRSARHSDDERHICLASGSLVLTKSGYIPIEDVNVGDLVLTHLGRWKPVIAKRCNGVNDVVRVTAQGVANLVCTPDHKLYTRMVKGARAKESAMKSDPTWVNASETIGSYLNLKLPPVEDIGLSHKECWIIGRWLGDGHRGVLRDKHGDHAPIVISCSHDEREDLIEELGEFAGSSQSLTAHQIAIRGLRKEVKKIIDRCGKGASNKRLPGELIALPQDKAKSLLDGYMSADGHYVERHDRQCASSVSRALLLGLAMVAQRANEVVSSVYAGREPGHTVIQGRIVKTRQDWIFTYRRTDGYKKSGWIDEQGAWKKVRKIEVVDATEVWDLQVADDASFTAEGCIVHNCPLQLDVVERAMQLWSAEGDTVFTPFLGIGTEAYVAVKMGRKAIGAELKASYFELACRNLKDADKSQYDMFVA